MTCALPFSAPLSQEVVPRLTGNAGRCMGYSTVGDGLLVSFRQKPSLLYYSVITLLYSMFILLALLLVRLCKYVSFRQDASCRSSIQVISQRTLERTISPAAHCMIIERGVKIAIVVIIELLTMIVIMPNKK